jgi:hypothetical protein
LRSCNAPLDMSLFEISTIVAASAAAARPQTTIAAQHSGIRPMTKIGKL